MYENFDGGEQTQALQASLAVREANLAILQEWGAYNLIKVKAVLAEDDQVDGYITLLPAISHQTPRQMEDLLGLRVGQLADGAHLYRLKRVPKLDEFLPRGYTTLVDGMRLKPGLTNSDGFRPGYGAFQVTLIKKLPAEWITFLKPDEPFEPGSHPGINYGRT